MESEILHGFIKQTEEYLPAIRGGILVCAQAGNICGELHAPLRQIAAIKNAASVIRLNEIVEICGKFEEKLKIAHVSKESPADEQIRELLDKLTELEAAITDLYFGAGGFSDNVSGFVEDSFRQFQLNENAPKNFARRGETKDEFEIDDEMLEVFALEAGELIGNIDANLEKLKKSPNDSEALLEIRRSAHTLKGSAGIIGLQRLSQIAHRVEDLLDYLATDKIKYGERIFGFLSASIDCFQALARDEHSERITEKIALIYADFDTLTTSLAERAENFSAAAAPEAESNPDKTPPPEAPEKTAENNIQTGVSQNRSIVRVSLDRLDELEKLTGNLAVNRSIFKQRLTEFENYAEFHKSDGEHCETTDDVSADSELDSLKSNLESLFDKQHRLIVEINDKLQRLRMVSFNSLSGRLLRTVRVTCEEEQKFAALFFDGDNLEIDTQILDCLIEPLLHLLRNAVAHGIEAPELRRLLGKPETGKISVRVSSDESHIVLEVSDDGRGISIDSLKEKAIKNNFVSREKSAAMSDAEAFELMFLPGLTTAENLSQVSGRGVGMNVVKTAVERRAGTISIVSEARKGTTFTLRLPLNPPKDDGAIQAAALSPDEENFPSSADNRASVLIVDDSPTFRRTISGLIKNAGYRLSAARDGIDALEILQSAGKLPDLILTDVEMPRMNGYELLAAIKARKDLCRIPVIMTTSREGEQYRRKAFNLGASEYLTKPFDDSALLNKIENLTKSI